LKIAILIKQIPDTDNVKLDPKTGNLMRNGVKNRINPLDLHVIEAAVQLKEKYGATIATITMGPPQADKVLFKALCHTCDEAYLLSDRAFGGADTYATAYTLSKAIEKIGDIDLIITGRNSDDGDTAQIGPAVAAFLDTPQITLANELDVKDGWVYCTRETEAVVEHVRAKLPAVVSVCKGINEPRYAHPLNILAAKEKEIVVWDAAALDAEPNMIGVPGSPSSTKKVFQPPKTNMQTKYYTGSVAEMAVQIVDDLSEKHFI
jgi:electron transfer flavoprotein beta subunit